MNTKVALITGAAKRIGAVIAERLHQAGFNVVIHYRRSADAAQALTERLNTQRPHSACCVAADLSDMRILSGLIQQAAAQWGRLDVLINNASDFYTTPLVNANQEQWDNIMASNLRAPFFLSQNAIPLLRQHQGCIINITDTYAHQPLIEHAIYCIAKAGLTMQTKALAAELAPDIRVNAIAPGSIFPPESALADKQLHTTTLARTALKRAGKPENISDSVLFLLHNDYITGHVLVVDGGRQLNYH